jgi:phosphate transport system protein
MAIDYHSVPGSLHFLRSKSQVAGKVERRAAAGVAEIRENEAPVRDASATQNSSSSRPKKSKTSKAPGAQDELTRLAMKACLIARDASFNVRDLLTNSSRMAFLAVKDCEKELDQIERYIDERMAAAITRVSEEKARELLACLKFITDLERIGDLLMGVALRLHSRSNRLAQADIHNLLEMAVILHKMLDQVHEGFVKRDLECVREVLRTDANIDRICHSMFQKHLASSHSGEESPSFDILLMAQALERSGDHAKNLAEELYSLIEGHSLRHPPKRKPSSN